MDFFLKMLKERMAIVREKESKRWREGMRAKENWIIKLYYGVQGCPYSTDELISTITLPSAVRSFSFDMKNKLQSMEICFGPISAFLRIFGRFSVDKNEKLRLDSSSIWTPFHFKFTLSTIYTSCNHVKSILNLSNNTPILRANWKKIVLNCTVGQMFLCESRGFPPLLIILMHFYGPNILCHD